MKLVEMNLVDFNEVLGSSAPAPGGGSVAALEGALAAGLCKMVGELSKGEEAEKIRERAYALMQQLNTAVDADTEAFNKVSAAFKLPKETEEEKAVRSAVIQEAMVGCIESPMGIMDLCNQVLSCLMDLEKDYNQNAASDLGVGVLSAEAAAKGAFLNVLINLGSLKDKEKAARYRQDGRVLMAEICSKAQVLQDKVLVAIGEESVCFK